ncbi:MAG: hypothetical protein AUJ28_02225 [Parcubacteria group bacterium CG1_02_37_51]|uniref:Rod shape-determining protein MreD n=1 Tax=Candidatus Komeilibacteria bacterium CG_4_10_14_0_8_um_filter_37_78 TaxID=1974471 RepID=A0A2M7RFK4_9BACT|nr:MAG: hypothetical protein AUJ28_02225 [Parcubacteria group bacterium CG1_02_37_51]PIY95341.1 MAG: hypothetical protein COY67_00600 [Candidatus Komeilibacteria bacterium CG_4_10_14_0_8_um_filter_37_78]
MKYKIHHYLFFFLFLLLLPILQLSLFGAWGSIGTAIHLVACFVIIAYFYISQTMAWWLALVGGFILDLHGHNFGEEMIFLSMIILILNILFRRWLVNRNLISLFFAGLISFSFYYLGLYLWQLLFVNTFQYFQYPTLSWSVFGIFLMVNIITIIVCFGILRLINKFFRYAPAQK